jgi:hypothetical protein
MPRPKYCPCESETPDPCPACGATVEGNDPVRGVCQAWRGYRRTSDVQLVLIDKETGAVVASTR